MPAPIMPAPRTPSFDTFDFSMPCGRRASLSALPLLTNSVRIMLRATGPHSSEPKYCDSIARPASKVVAQPSYMADWAAIGAGKLCLVFLAISALPPMKTWATAGWVRPPPGILKPFLSQGWTGSPLSSTQRRARSTISASGAISCTRPISSACSGFWLRHCRIIVAALRKPTRRGARWVPPAPGNRPMLTSGKPSTAPVSLASTR